MDYPPNQAAAGILGLILITIMTMIMVIVMTTIFLDCSSGFLGRQGYRVGWTKSAGPFYLVFSEEEGFNTKDRTFIFG